MAADSSATATATARFGAALIAIGVLVIGILHVVPPTSQISPLTRTISEYGLTSLSWAFNLAVLAVAGGTVAIGVALGRWRRLSVGAAAFGSLWVAGLVVLVMFPKHNWAIGPSASGQVHRMASLVAFLALPIALLLLTRAGGRAPMRPVFWLAPVALAWFVPIVVAIVLHPNGWWLTIPLGLIERGLALTEVVALMVLGLRPGAQPAIAASSARSADMVLP